METHAVAVSRRQRPTSSGGYWSSTRKREWVSAFDNAKVDAAFFPDGRWKPNFLLNLGYGAPARLFPRDPRLDFEEAYRMG